MSGSRPFVLLAIGMSATLCLLICAPVRADIMSPDDILFGKTIAEWAHEWWNWSSIEPIATNPILDETGEDGHLNQSGPIWFLAGTFGDPAVRTVNVPPGKTLFFPVVNVAWWSPEDIIDNGGNPDEMTEEEQETFLREIANDTMDTTSVLELTVDGQGALGSMVRAESPPGGFTLTFPEGSMYTEWGLDAGDRLAVADGYWVALDPLSLGEHVLKFEGVLGDPGDPDFVVDVTYNIVVPEPSVLFLLLSVGAASMLACTLRRRKRTAPLQ